MTTSATATTTTGLETAPSRAKGRSPSVSASATASTSVTASTFAPAAAPSASTSRTQSTTATQTLAPYIHRMRARTISVLFPSLVTMSTGRWDALMDDLNDLEGFVGEGAGEGESGEENGEAVAVAVCRALAHIGRAGTPYDADAGANPTGVERTTDDAEMEISDNVHAHAHTDDLLPALHVARHHLSPFTSHPFIPVLLSHLAELERAYLAGNVHGQSRAREEVWSVGMGVVRGVWREGPFEGRVEGRRSAEGDGDGGGDARMQTGSSGSGEASNSNAGDGEPVGLGPARESGGEEEEEEGGGRNRPSLRMWITDDEKEEDESEEEEEEPMSEDDSPSARSVPSARSETASQTQTPNANANANSNIYLPTDDPSTSMSTSMEPDSNSDSYSESDSEEDDEDEGSDTGTYVGRGQLEGEGEADSTHEDAPVVFPRRVFRGHCNVDTGPSSSSFPISLASRPELTIRLHLCCSERRKLRGALGFLRALRFR